MDIKTEFSNLRHAVPWKKVALEEAKWCQLSITFPCNIGAIGLGAIRRGPLNKDIVRFIYDECDGARVAGAFQARLKNVYDLKSNIGSICIMISSSIGINSGSHFYRMTERGKFDKLQTDLMLLREAPEKLEALAESFLKALSLALQVSASERAAYREVKRSGSGSPTKPHTVNEQSRRSATLVEPSQTFKS